LRPSPTVPELNDLTQIDFYDSDQRTLSNRTILFVDHAAALGGAERSLLMLLGRLDRYGWQPHLACTGGQLATDAAAMGIPYHLMAMPRLRRSSRFVRDLWGEARGLAALANQLEVEALYANTVRAAVYTSLASRISKRPFIWHMRDFWLSENKPARTWLDSIGKRFLIAASTAVVANSHAVAAKLPRSPAVNVVMNGIDLKMFRDESVGESFRADHAIPENALIVSTVGRLRPWKGQDRFLRIASNVRSSQPDAYFVIAGGSPFSVDDDYQPMLKRLAANLGLQDHVRFTGQLDDVRALLAATDIFIHAGDPEPFGLVNVEAMAMGLPVVAFAHGALPEIVVDGVTGILTPAIDESAMTRAVLRLIADPELRLRMGQTAKRLAVERFSIERTTGEINQLLQRYLGDRE